ncbi:MAG: hypothetical protein R3A79_02145 [Nannocystaceae bacterium]
MQQLLRGRDGRRSRELDAQAVKIGVAPDLEHERVREAIDVAKIIGGLASFRDTRA